jgi:hypothetical protein
MTNAREKQRHGRHAAGYGKASDSRDAESGLMRDLERVFSLDYWKSPGRLGRYLLLVWVLCLLYFITTAFLFHEDWRFLFFLFILILPLMLFMIFMFCQFIAFCIGPEILLLVNFFKKNVYR